MVQATLLQARSRSFWATTIHGGSTAWRRRRRGGSGNQLNEGESRICRPSCDS